MSCNNLEFRQRMTPDKKKKLVGIYDAYPCRWCMNCRVDRRNYWEDRLNYAHLVHKSASFVTFTYDDFNIPLNQYGKPTLLKRDWITFRDNLKRQLRYHGYPQLCFPDYKYYCVGEYGDQFGRPH